MKIYRNKATKFHPSIEIDSNEKTWKNMEVTQSPTKKNRYIVLKKNIDPTSTKKSYVRKYVRKDPIRTRGELLARFKLSEEDLLQIEEYLMKRKIK